MLKSHLELRLLARDNDAGTWCVIETLTSEFGPDIGSPDSGMSSCCTPLTRSRTHSSSAIPIASGTDRTLLGPSPTERSEEMPRSWRCTCAIGIPERSASEINRPIASANQEDI
jgi:hypothetical protein